MSISLLDQVLPYLPDVAWKLQSEWCFHRGVEALDVVHEVALRFRSKLPIARPDLEEYLPRLLMRACVNRAKDHFRAWKRYEPRHWTHKEGFQASKENTPLSQIVSRESREEILSHLTADQIEAVTLVEEGYTFSEIAEKLGIGEAAVRMRLHAARNRVLARMKTELGRIFRLRSGPRLAKGISVRKDSKNGKNMRGFHNVHEELRARTPVHPGSRADSSRALQVQRPRDGGHHRSGILALYETAPWGRRKESASRAPIGGPQGRRSEAPGRKGLGDPRQEPVTHVGVHRLSPLPSARIAPNLSSRGHFARDEESDDVATLEQEGGR